LPLVRPIEAVTSSPAQRGQQQQQQQSRVVEIEAPNMTIAHPSDAPTLTAAPPDG
jgi:hypothetical protein